MRRIYSYIIALSLFMLFTGCEESLITSPEAEIEIPTGNYIHFNTQVSTRGTLITDMKRNFAVTAFDYDKDWSTAVATALPTDSMHNQLVTWNGSLHTYDTNPSESGNQLKEWEEGKKYTFFAHQPTDLTISSSTTYGTPYLTYTLPADVANMVDIMTASVFDTDNTLGNTVGLTFKHRLTALGIQIRNLNKDNSIELDKLNISFINNTLKYNKATIPLDASMEMTRTVSGSVSQGPYSFISSGAISIPALETVSLDNAMIFIPQEGTSTDDFLQGNITYSYSDKNSDEEPQTFNVGRDMKVGRKYYLQMTFSAGAITIAIIESGEWTDKDVDIEFE